MTLKINRYQINFGQVFTKLLIMLFFLCRIIGVSVSRYLFYNESRENCLLVCTTQYDGQRYFEHDFQGMKGSGKCKYIYSMNLKKNRWIQIYIYIMYIKHQTYKQIIYTLWTIFRGGRRCLDTLNHLLNFQITIQIIENLFSLFL